MTLQTIVLIFALIHLITGATLINCPQNDIKFEKVIGVHPANLHHPLLLYKNDLNRPITSECIIKCNSNPECRSFVLFYNISTCYWFKNYIEGNIISVENDNDLVVDPETSWFRKVCLSYNNPCEKLWIFERIPGTILIGNDTKTLKNHQTRQECQQNCLKENQFECRSIKFKILVNEFGPNDETKGRCTLSASSRKIQPNSFRISGYEDEYLENQCTRPYENFDSFCSYEEYDNVTLSHSDFSYEKKTKENCQQLCDNAKTFNCRGYTITSTSNSNDNIYNCYLHSEDTKILGPKALKLNYNAKYYEKAPCINMSIICTETYMTVNFTPRNKFTGRIYMQGYSEHPECFATGSDYNTVTIKLSLLTNQCGIIRAKSPNDRTLTTGTMILQYNALIQTQGDRTIRIGCVFSNDSKVVIGTGVTISSNTPNRGSTLVNSTSSGPSPTVEMKVVDFDSQEEVSDTQIGQELQLVIEMKSRDLDMWAGHLVAMTERSDESILLLDERGCPTNPGIFPKLEKIVTSDTKILLGTFQAFKFSSSPIVRFSVNVQFCPGKCPEINCNNRRRKREILSRSLQTLNGTTVVKVNSSEFFDHFQNKSANLPLEFIMIVRSPNAITDRLVIGDHKILVAGYDYIKDEVCFNYSLFVGLIITWILIQIILIVICVVLVKRYKRHYEQECMRQSLEELHKNFGIGFSNLENRRVHWADNGDFT